MTFTNILSRIIVSLMNGSWTSCRASSVFLSAKGFVKRVVNLYIHTVCFWNPAGFFFCRRATHPERTRTEKNLVFYKKCVTGAGSYFQPARPGVVTLHTHTHVHLHTQVFKHLNHPDPDTVAKGVRGGGVACTPTQKKNKNHCVN